MIVSARELEGLTVHATDGDLGHVTDFFFDDEHWTLRYLVVRTGNWLVGHSVLVSPAAVTGADRDERRLTVSMTRQQVEHRPSIDSERPISRHQERNYLGYFGWPVYWGGAGIWGAGNYPGSGIWGWGATGGFPGFPMPAADARTSVSGAEPAEGDESAAAFHLRSAASMTGFAVLARDGRIGHVHDFLLDEQAWTIRYLVVDTGEWWPGRKVLLPPQWVERVDWEGSLVQADVSREQLRGAPEWNPAEPVTREYERALYDYYAREPYWEEVTGG